MDAIVAILLLAVPVLLVLQVTIMVNIADIREALKMDQSISDPRQGLDPVETMNTYLNK